MSGRRLSLSLTGSVASVESEKHPNGTRAASRTASANLFDLDCKHPSFYLLRVPEKVINMTYFAITRGARDCLEASLESDLD